MRQPVAILTVLALLVTAGCLGTADPGADAIDPAATDAETAQPPIPGAGNMSNLTHTVETVDLTWTQVNAEPAARPGPSRVEGENCFSFHTEGQAVIDKGAVTANWTPPEVDTSPHTILQIQASDLSHRVEHRLGPTHMRQDYTVDIEGWNITTEYPMDLLIGFVPPDQVYASTDHQATVTVELWHTGTVTDIRLGVCN